MTIKKINKSRVLKSIIENKARRTLDEMRNYVSEIERKFHNDMKSLRERFHEEINCDEVDPALSGEIAEYYSEENYIIENIYIKTFRYSSLISIYSFLEISMHQLCRYLKRHKNIEIEIEDIKGDGINRPKIYISKACGISFPDTSNEWNEIIKLNKIRNCLVHCEGNISLANSPSKLKNIINDTVGLSLVREKEIIIDSCYLDKSITNIESFITTLYKNSFD